MLERLLNTESFQAASGALDGLSARHSAISDNIANVNTPGYKRKDVPFEAALDRALHENACAPAGCAKPFKPTVTRDTATSNRPDGNNVDIEREMVMMADNTLRYQTLTQYVAGFFSGLKAVINSGGR
jgi:flagellar basal-body rod protein FlgB